MSDLTNDPAYRLTKRLMDNGVFDEMVACSLEDMVNITFDILEDLSKKFPLEPYQMVDYLDSIRFIKAAIIVLQHYTVNHYDEYQRKVNRYEDAIVPF